MAPDANFTFATESGHSSKIDSESKRLNLKYVHPVKSILKKCPLSLFKQNCAILNRALECGIETEINWAIRRLSLITSILKGIKNTDFAEAQKKNTSIFPSHLSQLNKPVVLSEYQRLLSESSFPSEALVLRLIYHSIPFFNLLHVFLTNTTKESISVSITKLIVDFSKSPNYYFGMPSSCSTEYFCTWSLTRYTQILIICLNLARSGYISHLTLFSSRSIVLLSTLSDGCASPILRGWELMNMSSKSLISISIFLLEFFTYLKPLSSINMAKCLTSLILNIRGMPWIYATRCFSTALIRKLDHETFSSLLECCLYVAISSHSSNIERISSLYFLQNLLEFHSKNILPQENYLKSIFETILHLYITSVNPSHSLSLDSSLPYPPVQLTSHQLALKFISISYDVKCESDSTGPVLLKDLYNQYVSWLEPSESPLSVLEVFRLFQQVFPNSTSSLEVLTCQWKDCDYESIFDFDEHFSSSHSHEAECKWENCNTDISNMILLDHYHLAHSTHKDVKLDVKTRKDNLIQVQLTEYQEILLRQLLKLLELFRNYSETSNFSFLKDHLEMMAVLCFTPAFLGESLDDSYERKKIFISLLSIVKF